MKNKIVALFILILLVIIIFTLPNITGKNSLQKINNSNTLNRKAIGHSMGSATNDSLKPPIMWTENFSNFYIQIRDDPGGNIVYYHLDWGDGNVEIYGPYESNKTIEVSYLWNDCEVEIRIKVKDQYNQESRWVTYGLIISSELNFFYLIKGYTNIYYTFTIYWNNGCDCWVYIDWVDGSGEWLGPYEQPLMFSYRTWENPGEYEFNIKLKDMYGNKSEWLTFTITILSFENNPPEPPTITGQTNGKAGVVYEYNFVSIDPEGDNISYYIDWGDKCGGYWIEPHPSGVKAKAFHGFALEGTYTINALAVDSYGAESSWGQLEVTMPFSFNKFDIYLIFYYLINTFLSQFY